MQRLGVRLLHSFATHPDSSVCMGEDRMCVPQPGDFLQSKSQHPSSSQKGQAFLVQISGAPHGTPERNTPGNRTPQISRHLDLLMH